MDNGKTLGQMIGVVEDNFSVTNDTDEKVQLRIKFDFSTSSDNDIKSWLTGNRRIALQRPLRTMNIDGIKDLNDTVIMAIDAGKKVKSLSERKAEARATLNALKAAYPEEFQTIIEEIEDTELSKV